MVLSAQALASAADIDRAVDDAVTRLARARAAAEAASKASPNDAFVHKAAAIAYRQTEAHALSLAHLERAASLAPADADLQYHLGLARQFTGDLDGAVAGFERAVALAPKHHRAWYSLVAARRQTTEHNHIQRLEALFPGPDPDGDRTLHIGHALAKTYEDFGDPRLSFDWLLKAKAVKRRLSPYALPAGRATFEGARRAFEAMRASGGEPSEEPIFVFGLPRTGTTLVDRILSSHPEVSSAGELSNFPLIFKKLAGTNSRPLIDRETLDRAAAIDPARLGRGYVESSRPLTGTTPRFVDKAPINFLYAGLIHRALPNARMICLRRDPIDSCLSNFRQVFPTPHPYYHYVHDLEHTAHQVAMFSAIADHWRNVLPPERYTEVSYEGLVANQEAETRRLVAFCGLEWSDRCLAFHENARAVATPSATQVRAPVYNTSIGRWKRYGDALAPALAVFTQAGLISSGDAG